VYLLRFNASIACCCTILLSTTIQTYSHTCSFGVNLTFVSLEHVMPYIKIITIIVIWWNQTFDPSATGNLLYGLQVLPLRRLVVGAVNYLLRLPPGRPWQCVQQLFYTWDLISVCHVLVTVAPPLTPGAFTRLTVTDSPDTRLLTTSSQEHLSSAGVRTTKESVDL